LPSAYWFGEFFDFVETVSDLVCGEPTTDGKVTDETIVVAVTDELDDCELPQSFGATVGAEGTDDGSAVAVVTAVD
jgi:hypothetical protein